MSITAQNSAGKRVLSLLDDNSFVEIGGYVTARSTDFNLTQSETPGDGVITGYGLIDGRLVYVYSQDASVLGGSVGEMHAKKITGLYDMAMKMGAPVIGLLDSSGLRLQEATDALNAFGEIYKMQSLASGLIPQISAVFGKCGGGLALIPGMTDFTFMEGSDAALFVNSPNAIPGNTKDKCDTSSAGFQSKETGMIDFVGTEDEILAGIRSLICMIPANNEEDLSYMDCEDDLNRVCADLANTAGDTSILLSNIADDQYFLEMKSDYAPDMVTGFLRLNGTTVGAVANRSEIYDADGELTDSFDSVISARGARKAAQFVSFCDAFEIPVLSVTNATGFEASECSEKEMAKAAAKLSSAFASATVPTVNLITGKAFGSAYVVMNSKALGADVTFAWTDAQIGMMDANLAAKIMYADEDASVISEKAADYASLQSSALSAAKRGYVDNIIAPEDTRKYVIGAFEMLYSKSVEGPVKKHGTV